MVPQFPGPTTYASTSPLKVVVMLNVAVIVLAALMVPKPPLMLRLVDAPTSELSGTATLIAPLLLVMLKVVGLAVVVNVAGSPKHTVVGVATVPAVTAGATVTVWLAVFTQPLPSVPVTVYVVVVVGAAETGEPVVGVRFVVGLQVYVVAPPAAKDTLPVPQIKALAGVGVMVTVGSGFTVTVPEAVFVQPVTPSVTSTD